MAVWKVRTILEGAGLCVPAGSESAWRRASRETRTCLHSVRFWLAEIVAVAVGVYLLGGVGSLIAPVALLVLMFVSLWATAPGRQRNDLAVELNGEDRRVMAELLGTELRDIRRKVEKVRSMRHPVYWDGFQLPAYRFDEWKAELAKQPELYRLVEHAYVLANDVNEAVVHRRTLTTSRLIGPHPSDPLDAAYDAAGVALDALGKPRGEPFLTVVEQAAQNVIDSERAATS
jgi:hypothetical protein